MNAKTGRLEVSVGHHLVRMEGFSKEDGKVGKKELEARL